MTNQLESFLLQIPDLQSQKPANLIDYFVYFSTVIAGQQAVNSNDVETCFEVARLTKYSNIPAYLSRNTKLRKKSRPKFIKTGNGYQLERNWQLEIQKTLNSGPAKIETSHLLRGLLSKLYKEKAQSFLQEAIDCYEISARRAAIVMVWILTVYHLYEYILKKQLSQFNAVLATNTDKRIKITKIQKLDDFTEIPEGKFIELARTAKIITNDVRKILETKLGIRNSSAHPAAITISEVKATDFIIDLVENVILKYKI